MLGAAVRGDAVGALVVDWRCSGVLNITNCTKVVQAGEQLIWLLSSGNPACDVDPLLAQSCLAPIIPMAVDGRVTGAGEALDQQIKVWAAGESLPRPTHVDRELESFDLG